MPGHLVPFLEPEFRFTRQDIAKMENLHLYFVFYKTYYFNPVGQLPHCVAPWRPVLAGQHGAKWHSENSRI